jgi:hypothetical protein
MKIWQIDLHQIPTNEQQQTKLWKLLICNAKGEIIYEDNCPQAQVNSTWLVTQINQAANNKLPDLIQVFRPQILGLLTLAAEELGIAIEATRHTKALKQELIKLNYNPLAIDKPPPQPLPENLWGEEWNFASIVAGEILAMFSDRPIPFLNMPEFLLPLNLGIASTTPIPGIVIYGGRNSLQLARWLQEQKLVALNYIPTEVGKSGGLILEAGLAERWIVATFENDTVAQGAQLYEQRKETSQGLHFLLLQPDNSGMTLTGFWLLQEG